MTLFKHQKGERVPVKREPARRDEWMDQFFSPLFADDWMKDRWLDTGKTWAPAMNIHESKDGYMVETELPGVDRDNIDVDVENNYLVIKGEKKSFNEDKRKDYHHVERTHGSFYRSVALPEDVDKEKVSATLKDGVLTVDLGRCDKKAQENRRIDIR